MNETKTKTQPGEGPPQLFAEVCTDLLKQGFSVTFRAPGWSMHPTIRDGEIITAEPVAPGRLKWGEIALYRVGEALLAHRVVGLRRRDGCPQLLVRGDAPGAQDEGVTAGQILGRVVCTVRGHKSLRLSTATARILWLVRHTGYRLRGWLVNRILPSAEGSLP
jgi:signal peptidase I